MTGHLRRYAGTAAGVLLAVATTQPHMAMAQDAMPGMAMPPPATHAATEPAHATAKPAHATAKPAHASPVHAHPTTTPAPAPSTAPAMPDMDMGGMPMATEPSATRSANYSDGYTYGTLPGMHMRDSEAHGALVLDQLEYVHWNTGHAFAVDGEAWYGGDRNKLWLNFEGEHADGKLEDLRTEALWSHAVTAYWDTQLGVRHDFGGGPGRTWAAFGIEGLAPYWLTTTATFYVGQGGRTAARIEADYAMRFTQRWILQPRIEINAYGQDDPQRGIGSGLSEVEAGLRLRYEIRREFAPYIGLVRVQRLGQTAAFARAAGGAANETRVVAGVRLWY